MKAIIASLLGFEWIQNVLIKNAARVAAVAILALAAKTPWVASMLASLGITGDMLTNGLIAVALTILGAIRGWAKPPPPVVK